MWPLMARRPVNLGKYQDDSLERGKVLSFDLIFHGNDILFSNKREGVRICAGGVREMN